jgi:hypothetical protein
VPKRNVFARKRKLKQQLRKKPNAEPQKKSNNDASNATWNVKKLWTKPGCNNSARKRQKPADNNVPQRKPLLPARPSLLPQPFVRRKKRRLSGDAVLLSAITTRRLLHPLAVGLLRRHHRVLRALHLQLRQLGLAGVGLLQVAGGRGKRRALVGLRVQFLLR